MKTNIKKSFKSKWLFIKINFLLKFTNNSWCKIGPHKTIGFLGYTLTRSFLRTFNHIFKVLKYVIISIKNVFKENACLLKLNYLLKLKNKSLCRGSPDKTIKFCRIYFYKIICSNVKPCFKSV